MTDYNDFEKLIKHSDPSSAASGRWNWTTISDFMLEPDEEDDLYHITYSYIGSASDIPYASDTTNADLDAYYDNFLTADTPLRNVINGILNPTNAYTVLFTDVAPIDFDFLS